MYEQLNGKKEFTRTNSICPTPESVLLELVLQNDRDNVSRLIKNNPKLLNHIYYPEYNKPILLIACSKEQVEAETVKTLIDLGADLHYSNEIDEEWEAIHFAAHSTNSDVLKVIVKSFKNPSDINALAKGNNALHILIKYGRMELIEESVECAKILIQEGIDVNLGDNNGVSPILLAANKKYKHIIKVILETSVVAVDIDSHKFKNKTAREIIDKKLYEGTLPDKTDNNNEKDENILFRYLHSENENAFINFKNGDIFDLVDTHNGSSTLLQVSCDKRMTKAVEHLINKGADPNSTPAKNRKKPIEIVAENGSYEIFEMLVHLYPKIDIPKTVLITLLKYADSEEFPGISHAKCCKALLKQLTNDENLLDINDTDDQSKNSPLHYAVRYATPETVKKLLRLGASLGSKNQFGVMPIQDITPKELEEHLDSCIQFDTKSKQFDKQDFSVTFDYRTLIPPTKKLEYNAGYESSDPEANLEQNTTEEVVAETEVISYMSKAPEFKHLLTHPVVVSFLFVKWHRIRWLFYINLAFYITFLLSLVVYIFTWYVNFSTSEKSSFFNFLIDISWIVFWITYLFLILRELFQIAVDPKGYFKNFVNYVEIVLIFFSGSILFINAPSDDTKKILSSVSILLSTFELVLMVGQHPKLSTNVVMLKTVSFNFFKFLMWYSLLIIAFALSFYILFTNTEPAPKNNTEGEEEEDFFTDPGKSVFKTIVMLTGEFDAGSMNFHDFPITSKIIFSLFVFMIAIILLNLLNGLAVSDTQMIKNNAELVGHITRAQHIRYVESMVLGNILPNNLLQIINRLCCCLPVNANSNFSVFKPLAEKACLFPHYLNYKLIVYPNKGGQICLPPGGKNNWTFGNCCYTCSYNYLDKETVKRTNNIIRKRREEIKTEEKSHYLQEITEKIVSLNNNTESNKLDIYMLIKKVDSILERLRSENDG